MLRKLLIVAIACFVVIAAPSAMYTVQAQLAVSANHQFSIAAAATKAPTATSKSKSATKTPTASSKGKSATKIPTATSKSKSAKTPTPVSKASHKRDLNDPRGATAKCNDGTYYHGACSNHKGVKEWLKP